ncbi:UNVERIFIED_CONTAM: hypothetical protein RMT77_008458 [Armadillidium vulgare]
MSEQTVKRYKQKFRDSWFENKLFCNWLAASEEPDTAYCKACNCTLKAKLSLLMSHRLTKKHIKCMATYDRIINAKEEMKKRKDIDKKLLLDHYKVVRGFGKRKRKSFQTSLENHPVVLADEMKEENDTTEKDDHCSSPLRLSDSEHYDFSEEIENSSNSEKDVESYSQNFSSKSFSEKCRRFKKLFKTYDSPPTKRLRKCSREYRELNSGKRNTDEDALEHEVVSFGKSIAAQMRNLPEERIVRLSAEIQRLVTQERIEYLEERKAQNVDTLTPIISYSYKTEGETKNIVIQSDSVSTINNGES